MNSIGILGGTFDPVHNGHLRIAIEVAEAFGFEEVRLIPLSTPHHRPPPSASDVDREAMLNAAIEPPLVLDACELEREGVSYTVDTLTAFRDRRPDCTLNLILGMDAFLGLPDWHQPDRVFELANLIVVSRPGAKLKIDARLEDLVAVRATTDRTELKQAACGRICFFEAPEFPISATDIRARCAQGRSVRYLVPESVAEIIRQRGLYQA